MSVANLPFEPTESAKVAAGLAKIAAALAPARVTGGLSVDFASDGATTRAARVAEADGYRVRFPRGGLGCEAVMINTGGGVAGGDVVRIAASVGEAAVATITSSAAERVYRSLGVPARIEVSLDLQAGSTLAWLPQETILYNGSSLARRVDVAMSLDARLTFADIIVLGRRASGETMTDGRIRDRWTVRRAGRVAHVEAVRLDGEIDAAMQRPAIGGGAHVMGTVLHMAPNAGDHVVAVRSAVAGSTARIAVSAWEGRLVVRALGDRSDHVRQALALALRAISGHPLPRVWAT